MDSKTKLAKLEEIMDLDEGGLSPDTVLRELECWDSMTKLSLIVMVDDEFGKTLAGDQIRAFVTVQDIMDYMA